MSVFSDFEALTPIHISVYKRDEEHLQRLCKFTGEPGVAVSAVAKLLTLVKEYVGGPRGWCKLLDAKIHMIDLLRAICDRLKKSRI